MTTPSPYAVNMKDLHCGYRSTKWIPVGPGGLMPAPSSSVLPYSLVSLKRNIPCGKTAKDSASRGRMAKQLGCGSASFNLTYASLMNAESPLFHPWMLDANMTRGEVVYDGRPFDHVLVASLLHDITRLPSPKDYREVVGEQF